MDTPSNEPTGNPADGPERPAESRMGQVAELLVALAFVALGIVVLIETQDIRVAKAYSKVGPRVIPTIVGWGAIVIGVWYAVDVLRGNTAGPSDDAEDADPSLPADWSTLAGLAAALVLYAVLMKPAGYVMASTIMFWVAAWSMGSRSYLRDVLIGLVVSVASYYAFKEGLNIRLPQGIWFW